MEMQRHKKQRRYGALRLQSEEAELECHIEM